MVVVVVEIVVSDAFISVQKVRSMTPTAQGAQKLFYLFNVDNGRIQAQLDDVKVLSVVEVQAGETDVVEQFQQALCPKLYLGQVGNVAHSIMKWPGGL